MPHPINSLFILSGDLCCRPKPLDSVRTESDVCLSIALNLAKYITVLSRQGYLKTEHKTIRPMHAGTRPAPSPAGSCGDGSTET